VNQLEFPFPMEWNPPQPWAFNVPWSFFDQDNWWDLLGNEPEQLILIPCGEIIDDARFPCMHVHGHGGLHCGLKGSWTDEYAREVRFKVCQTVIEE
jgi:hypothetical protein